MGRIRPFTLDDLQAVVALNQRVFPGGNHLSPETQRNAMYNACCRNPWYDDALPSLVYEEGDGMITGFLGVVARRMYLGDRPVRMAVSQHLLADPASRSKLVGIHLMKAFMRGPQDLSLANEATDVSRMIWERLGGDTCLLYSQYWVRPLRPFCYGLLRFRSNGRPAAMARAMRPLGRVADAMAVRMPGNPFRLRAVPFSEEALTAETLLECLSRHTDARWLRPDYNARSLSWVLDMFAREPRFGPLQKVLLRNEKGHPVGWYLYYLNRCGNSHVLQLGGEKRMIGDVLDHLAGHAWQRGATGLFGQLEPRLMPAHSREVRKFGFITPGSNWMLAHAKDPDLLQAIHRGAAFLSRLEGELKLL